MEWTPALILSLVLGAVIGYLLGSLNFSIIISKVMMHDDVRNHGSGNAGLTNALRTMGKGPAVLTLIGDFFKGIIAILLSRLIYKYLGGVPSDAMFLLGDYIPAFFALLGHVFPLYYKFKGGKGILVSFGALMVMSPRGRSCCVHKLFAFCNFHKICFLGLDFSGGCFAVCSAALPLHSVRRAFLVGGFVFAAFRFSNSLQA